MIRSYNNNHRHSKTYWKNRTGELLKIRVTLDTWDGATNHKDELQSWNNKSWSSQNQYQRSLDLPTILQKNLDIVAFCLAQCLIDCPWHTDHSNIRESQPEALTLTLRSNWWRYCTTLWDLFQPIFRHIIDVDFYLKRHGIVCIQITYTEKSPSSALQMHHLVHPCMSWFQLHASMILSIAQELYRSVDCNISSWWSENRTQSTVPIRWYVFWALFTPREPERADDNFWITKYHGHRLSDWCDQSR